jgi:CheY-like chemotaxis protein
MNFEKKRKTVLAAVDDMFFWAKIEAVAKGLGVDVVQAANAQMLEERLEASTPDLIIVDLNSKACSPIEAIRRIKGRPSLQRVPLVAFFSHIQVELEQAAQEAGCETIMPRSTFTKNLPQILGE